MSSHREVFARSLQREIHVPHVPEYPTEENEFGRDMLQYGAVNATRILQESGFLLYEDEEQAIVHHLTEVCERIGFRYDTNEIIITLATHSAVVSLQIPIAADGSMPSTLFFSQHDPSEKYDGGGTVIQFDNPESVRIDREKAHKVRLRYPYGERAITGTDWTEQSLGIERYSTVDGRWHCDTLHFWSYPPLKTQEVEGEE